MKQTALKILTSCYLEMQQTGSKSRKGILMANCAGAILTPDNTTCYLTFGNVSTQIFLM
jgi:hypothetical protein